MFANHILDRLEWAAGLASGSSCAHSTIFGSRGPGCQKRRLWATESCLWALSSYHSGQYRVVVGHCAVSHSKKATCQQRPTHLGRSRRIKSTAVPDE